MGAGVARELVARRFGQVAPAVDAVHDLQRAIVVRLQIGDELHELVGLPVEVEVVQRLEGEGRVPHPREPVVPVPLTARGLGQRRGQRRDRSTGRHVGQSLDRQRGALDRLAPAVVGRAGAVEPPAPVAAGRREARVGLVDALRCREVLRPRERAVAPVALRERVPRPDPVPLDPQLHIRLQPDGHARAARVGGVPVVAEGPLGRRAPVVERGLADQLHVDAAVQAQHGANQHVVPVRVRRRARVRGDLVLTAARAHCQRVEHDDPAGRRMPRGYKRVRPRLVEPRVRDIDPEGRKPERAGLPIQQGAEDARRVEAGDAQPLDRPVGRDQRAGVAIGEERVVGDRWERRRCGRALGLGCGGRLAVSLGGLRRLGVGLRALRRLGGLGLGRAHHAPQGSCQVP